MWFYFYVFWGLPYPCMYGFFFTGIKLGVDARILGEWWMSPTKPSNFSWNIAFMLQGPHQGSPGHHDRPPRGRKRENQPVVWEYSLGISWIFFY